MTGGEHVGEVCGDGSLDPGELCDDGNVQSGDGCESDCTETIGVAAFSAGGAHTCALSFEGTVRCFGDNTFGQLGTGDTETIGDDETPLESEYLVKLPQVTQVSAGLNHTCAISTEHDLYCWGANESGQLGLGHRNNWGDDSDEAPARVDLGGAVSAVAAGESHTCALLYGGEVRCWGAGDAGQLGHGDGFGGIVGSGDAPYANVLDAPPVELDGAVIRTISAGLDHTCVVDALGDAYCWGEGADGRLGNASGDPVGIDDAPAREGIVAIDATVAGIGSGASHSCLVTHEDRALHCFGANADGRLGLGHTKPVGDNEPLDDFSVQFGDEQILSVALTDSATCARTAHETVFCWGRGDNGQLGYGSSETVGDDELPREWEGFGPVKLSRAATQIDAGSEHVCARTDDARLRCWGRADLGQLGQGHLSTEFHGDQSGEFEPLIVRVFR
jgi:cysteine-rich repeat protein